MDLPLQECSGEFLSANQLSLHVSTVVTERQVHLDLSTVRYASENSNRGRDSSKFMKTSLLGKQEMFSLKIHTVTSSGEGQEEKKEIQDEMSFDTEDSKLETELVKISLGNPRVEITRGVVHLYRDINEKPGSLARLPVKFLFLLISNHGSYHLPLCLISLAK